MALRATDLINRSCLKCESEFQTQYRNIKRGRGKFCTKTCSNSFDLNRISKREKQLDLGNKDTYRKSFGANEHRVVMEKILYRKLLSTEIVHHKDGNKRNNNPENLELYSNNADHIRDHLKTNIGKCIIEECSGEQKRKNMCFKHYYRNLRQKNSINQLEVA